MPSLDRWTPADTSQSRPPRQWHTGGSVHMHAGNRNGRVVLYIYICAIYSSHNQSKQEFWSHSCCMLLLHRTYSGHLGDLVDEVFRLRVKRPAGGLLLLSRWRKLRQEDMRGICGGVS